MKLQFPSLDPVVKVGLGVLVGSFVLIGIGMFLSRPDRSIPPYSIGSQQGHIVAIHIPGWTSDPEIETLIRRFRKIGGGSRDFGSMKIRPTTPEHPKGQYYNLTIYIFSEPSWAAFDALHRYLILSNGDHEEEVYKREFEQAARGGYILENFSSQGWLGPIPQKGTDTPNHFIQVLFNDDLSAEDFAPTEAQKL